MIGVGPRAPSAVDALVFAALPEEMRPLRAKLADLRRLAGEKEIWQGWLAGRQVALVVTGDGERNARAGAAAAFRWIRAGAAIAIGVAGGLSPGLAAGDLLVAHRVMREDGDAWEGSTALLAASARLYGARPAALIAAPRLAATQAEKRRLAKIVAERAPGMAAAVDLESAAIVAAAAARGVPWLVLRAVSDEAGEELPPLLNDCLDEGGAVRRGLLAVRLFRQPSVLPRLLFLRQRVRACADTLAAATTTVLASLGQETGGRHLRVPAPAT